MSDFLSTYDEAWLKRHSGRSQPARDILAYIRRLEDENKRLKAKLGHIGMWVEVETREFVGGGGREVKP